MKEDLGNFTDLFSDIVNAEVQNVNLNSKKCVKYLVLLFMEADYGLEV